VLQLLRELGLLNRELKIRRVGGWLYIPLAGEPSPSQLEKLQRSIPSFELTTQVFEKRAKRPSGLGDLLADRLPPHLLASLPRSIDFVGEVAILEVPPELEAYRRLIGEAVMKLHPRVHTVLAKRGGVTGPYRLRRFEVIAGVGRTETVHREYGCTYHVDVAKVYFSPRLSYEHSRVASLVGEGETVVDMFAGVGPFSILIAKRRRHVQVYAIDINPNAIQYLTKNIQANHVEGKVIPIQGDARAVIRERLRGVADRVIMNLPERAIEYVDAACEAIKPQGGIIHYYEFSSGENPLEKASHRIVKQVERSGRKVEEVLSSRIVRESAPYTWQVAVDVRIR